MHTLLWKSLEDLGQGASHTAVSPAFREQWGNGCCCHMRWPQLSLGPLAATLPELGTPNVLPSSFSLIYLLFIFGHEACGISVPQPGIELTSPALEGRFVTTGPPGTSLFPLLESCRTIKTSFWESVQAHACFSWWYLCHLWFGAKEFNFDPLPCGCESWFSGGFSQLQM